MGRSDVVNATRVFTAKFLQQIQEGNPPVPVEIFVQAKAKEPPTDALPKFVEAYTSLKRVGSLVKETSSGKLMTEWEQAISKADNKPEVVDMAPALSAFMAVKDEEEMVRSDLSSGVSGLLTHGSEMHSYRSQSYFHLTCSPYCIETGDDLGQRSQDNPRAIRISDRGATWVW